MLQAVSAREINHFLRPIKFYAVTYNFTPRMWRTNSFQSHLSQEFSLGNIAQRFGDDFCETVLWPTDTLFLECLTTLFRSCSIWRTQQCWVWAQRHDVPLLFDDLNFTTLSSGHKRIVPVVFDGLHSQWRQEFLCQRGYSPVRPRGAPDPTGGAYDTTTDQTQTSKPQTPYRGLDPR